MDQEQHITFGPFRLEMPSGRLWHGQQALTLRPRSMAVLHYLAQHPGHLVTKAELHQHVWAGTHVTDTVLRVCIREIRAVLGDAAAAPQYVETVGQQGYRLLVSDDGSTAAAAGTGPIVGRQRDIDTLERYYQRVSTGERQVVFVSGEAGIGKTTLVDLFLARWVAGGAVWIGRGQCVEPYGEIEPYLPLLEALGGLCRGPEGHEILAGLRQYAPMWLIQLPGLVNDAELERIQRQVHGATQARMVRELAELLHALTLKRPLVLVLEDMHWSDNATVECLAYLAQRREPAQLLVLSTYRLVEAILRAHPLRGLVQELCGRGQSDELRLELLPAEDVTAYAAGRLGGAVHPALALLLHERTEGNALFMVNLLEHLVQQRLLVRQEAQWTLRPGAAGVGLPEGLRQLLLRCIEALPMETRRLLETASVVGETFAAAAVAAAAQCRVEAVEAVCDALVTQQHLLDDAGLAVWPDGTRSGSYRFQHVLYQQVLYEQLGTARRTHLHQRIGACLEAGYGTRTVEIAAQLAVHFEQGVDVPRAICYLQQAGNNAAQRNAYPETIAILNKGLALLATLPDSPERAQHELSIQLALGDLQIPIKGRMAPEVQEAYTRAYVLCQQMEETPQLLRALWGLVQFHGAQAQLRTADELSQQLFLLAQRQPDPVFLLEGHLAMGVVALYRGDLIVALTHLEQSLRLSRTMQSSSSTVHGGFVPGVTSLTWSAQALWGLGYADQAQQRGQEAIALAQQMEHAPSVVFTHLFAAQLAQFRRDVVATQAYADAAITLATAQGFALRVAQARMLRGWALAMQGAAADGVAQLRQGLDVSHGAGPDLVHPYWLALLAEAYRQAGESESALQVLDEALALMAATEGRWWEAELYRLKGETWQHAEAGEACFQQALAVARCQQARALELRAALSLSRLWQQRGELEAARELLVPIYDGFSEGFATPDQREAKALLEYGLFTAPADRAPIEELGGTVVRPR